MNARNRKPGASPGRVWTKEERVEFYLNQAVAILSKSPVIQSQPKVLASLTKEEKEKEIEKRLAACLDTLEETLGKPEDYLKKPEKCLGPLDQCPGSPAICPHARIRSIAISCQILVELNRKAPRVSKVQARLEKLSKTASKMSKAVKLIDKWTADALFSSEDSIEVMNSFAKHGFNFPNPIGFDPNDVIAWGAGLEKLAEYAEIASKRLQGKDRGGNSSVSSQTDGRFVAALILSCVDLLTEFKIPVRYSEDSELACLTRAIMGVVTGAEKEDILGPFRQLADTASSPNERKTALGESLEGFERISLQNLIQHEAKSPGTKLRIPPPPDTEDLDEILTLGHQTQLLLRGVLPPRKR